MRLMLGRIYGRSIRTGIKFAVRATFEVKTPVKTTMLFCVVTPSRLVGRYSFATSFLKIETICFTEALVCMVPKSLHGITTQNSIVALLRLGVDVQNQISWNTVKWFEKRNMGRSDEQPSPLQYDPALCTNSAYKKLKERNWDMD